ncbi:hypothetical protein ATANTOWER_025288 [Ataeniobius toweri]|uniref:Secreted protein n=1 Tax=Ataeniobius toweri TaxID=208326 RepID=A0ABU7AA14_9TELE|nr:hypothetical protein [Ataeniobius toweri]
MLSSCWKVNLCPIFKSFAPSIWFSCHLFSSLHLPINSTHFPVFAQNNTPHTMMLSWVMCSVTFCHTNCFVCWPKISILVFFRPEHLLPHVSCVSYMPCFSGKFSPSLAFQFR